MNIASAVAAWVAVHPYQTALHAVNGVILLTPAAVTVPIFSALGFTASGPAAGMPLFYYNGASIWRTTAAAVDQGN